MTVTIRALTAADAPQLTLLNNAAVPAVPHMSEGDLDAVRARADVAIAVVDDRSPDAVLGFLLALSPGADYDSENYRWFEARGVDGLYVDRIVVAESARGLGLGATLYRSAFAAARAEGRAEVTCEVNVEPPNPGSLAFHATLGFSEVGRQPTKNGLVVVSLLAAPVDLLAAPVERDPIERDSVERDSGERNPIRAAQSNSPPA